MHTSPLAQPGHGDAGGMNVYIDRSLRALLKLYPRVSVEVFTLVTQPPSREVEQVSHRALVHQIYLPEAAGATKANLHRFIKPFAVAVRRRAQRPADVIHSHYWLSGLVALDYAGAAAVVHTMHTTAAAKDARAGAGEPAEPQKRREAERYIVEHVSALVVNTDLEAQQMIDFYGADPQKIAVISPGVDTGVFAPSPHCQPAHAGSATAAKLVFAGRPQPLKGPHILVEALALLPSNLNVELTIIGKSGTDYEAHLLERARELGLAEKVHLLDPLTPRKLAEQFRLADIVACPSSSETFGLVALEAQACGTPVLASRVDGLVDAVEDGVSGILVKDRTPGSWAQAIEGLVRDPHLRAHLGQGARQRTKTMQWADTAYQLVDLYYRLTISPVQGES